MMASSVLAGTATDLVWTPEAGWTEGQKLEGPGAEEFGRGMASFRSGEYGDAKKIFKKIVKQHPSSPVAEAAQFLRACCFDREGDYLSAYYAYQRVLDDFPKTDRLNEVVRRQYQIGGRFIDGEKRALLGWKILSGTGKGIEILQQVVDNDPYGELADDALYQVGHTQLGRQKYQDAIEAYRRLLQDHPQSEYASRASQEKAECHFLEVDGTDHDVEKFRAAEANLGKAAAHHDSAAEKLQDLNARKAENMYDAAVFYLRQDHVKSAIVYFEAVIKEHPSTEWAERATRVLEVLKRRDEW